MRPVLRNGIYQTEKLVQWLRFVSLREPRAGWPILLGISFPKSGTHLLDQILVGFSRVAPFSFRLHSFYAEYDGETGIRRSPKLALDWLDSLRPRDVASAHLFAQPETIARVQKPGFLSFFIFRDPRDVVVSHAYYITEMNARHVHHGYFASLPDIDSRLRASILGRSGLDIEFPDIASRFAPYKGWMDCPQVLKLRFEDLVEERVRTLGLILDHFLARVSIPIPRQAILAELEASINPRRSPTFRSGKTGEWRQHFTAEHKDLFKSVTGDLLIQLGYETGHNW